MLKAHLPRVMYHRVYFIIQKEKGRDGTDSAASYPESTTNVWLRETEATPVGRATSTADPCHALVLFAGDINYYTERIH